LYFTTETGKIATILLHRIASANLEFVIREVYGCYYVAFASASGIASRTGRLLFMRIKRRLPIFLVVLLVAAAVALVVVLRKHAPPEPARLLPTADGFAYINLEWIRRANITGQLPTVPHDPEYEQFIRETGFEFERDLDHAAFAIHYPGKGLGDSQEARFSEVFVGKIDGERLRAYLHKISGSVEDYGSTDIYVIPLAGRTLRVAILGVDTVAASNNSDPEVIRGIISRSRKLASPFGGPALLRQYYRHVPLGSLAWAILRTGGSSEMPVGSNPLGLDSSFLFSKPAVVVGSARYLVSVHLRAEGFTGSEEEAQRMTEKVKTFLNLFGSAEISVAGASDPDVKKLFSSLKVEQHKDRAVLTAVVPTNFIRKLVAEVPNEVGPGEPQETPSPGEKKPTKEKKPSK
jgi:hypothetical protein